MCCGQTKVKRKSARGDYLEKRGYDKIDPQDNNG